jgi:hypothetical protein
MRLVVAAKEVADGRHISVPLFPERHVRGLFQDHLLGRPDPGDQVRLERPAGLVVPPGDDQRRDSDLAQPARAVQSRTAVFDSTADGRPGGPAMACSRASMPPRDWPSRWSRPPMPVRCGEKGKISCLRRPWPAGPRGRHREPAAVSGTARPGAAAGARDAVIPGMALAAIQINPFSRNVAETVETGA